MTNENKDKTESLVESMLINQTSTEISDAWKTVSVGKPTTEILDAWKTATSLRKPITEILDTWKTVTSVGKPTTDILDAWKTATSVSEPMTEILDAWKTATSVRKPITEVLEAWKTATSVRKPITEILDTWKTASVGKSITGISTALSTTSNKISSVKFSKNLVVPIQTLNQFYSNVDNKSANKIFKGISPDDYSIKSNIENNKFNTIIVKSSGKEEIPVKSFVSTVGATDLLESISKNEAVSFYLHLADYPMLGGEHEVGRRIIEQLDTVKTISLEKNIKLFRARPRDKKKRPIPYTQPEMFSAPFGLSKQGRYNVVGQGELYTCDNKEIAIRECVKDKDTTFDVIDWELIEPVKMIDLTNKKHPLVEFCTYSLESSSGLDYLVPNFIAQCAKSKGITGIVYRSKFNDDVYNYVFFDYQYNWFRLVSLYELLSA
ncbi:RES family NAD+ phosphorylase [Streptomyces avermitilis]|uniref:RES family NAD+ phosphorylase n=1 Tax=Streptomyces avermitilis TaxID=33903 RepID=UPI0037F492E6